jgi:FtsH-binding integral membrane protein
MSKIIQLFFDWSEVWALLIPLFVWIFSNKQPSLLKSIIVYLWLALTLNLFGDVVADFKKPYHFPLWLQSNTPVYNIHSVVRFVCFSYFFLSLPQPQFKTLKKAIVLVFFLFVIIDFAFFEDFFNRDHLSGNLLSAEAYLLLIFCMLYYLAVLNDEDDTAFKGPVFWIVTGLSIYVAVNFFVFLFYVPMNAQNWRLADNMWSVHNWAYIILCLFITRALYLTTEQHAATGN